ncbi:hypothetical protein SAMN05878482_106344 [Peribacillus simplex]|uniref:Uncharacterized protein n=1 Tax=Peribacillus simplex TaxID=1478 RepID=A0A9X8RCF0_9BACI|nr:hypothetical protein [Peribacillus simplex]SIR87664.1 hypothetical protein SAMN05878482_106344 [Peribacillus simplex]
MGALVVGLLFLIPGIIFLLLVMFKYTEEEHQKELIKYQWVRNDRFLSWVEWELVLFHKIASKSYIIAKVIILLISLIPIAIGILALWAFFSG